jgi:hypothetical protein
LLPIKVGFLKPKFLPLPAIPITSVRMYKSKMVLDAVGNSPVKIQNWVVGGDRLV